MEPDSRPSRRGALVLRLAALAAVCGLGAALTFGYLGRLHFAFDSFSHLRLHFAALLLLLVPALAALRFRAEALFALALGIAAPVQTVFFPPRATVAEAEAGRATYRLMHVNLRYDNATPEAFLSLVGRTRPDAITLTEVSEPWAAKLVLIEAAYPYRIVCERPTFIGGAAILSRRPFAEGTAPFCGNRGAFAHASVDFGGQTIEIVALHMGWPWPFEQPWQIPRLEPLLADVGADAILAGDLNAVPWSQAARRLATAAGARILHGTGPTWLDRRLPAWLIPWIGLPLDNIMVKGRVAADTPTTLDDVGSDHLPVMLEFSLAPAEGETVVAKISE